MEARLDGSFDYGRGIQPRQAVSGDVVIPFCAQEDCCSYDGKRCKLMGFRPSNICEPAVAALGREAKRVQDAAFAECEAIAAWLEKQATAQAGPLAQHIFRMPAVSTALRSAALAVRLGQHAPAPAQGEEVRDDAEDA